MMMKSALPGSFTAFNGPLMRPAEGIKNLPLLLTLALNGTARRAKNPHRKYNNVLSFGRSHSLTLHLYFSACLKYFAIEIYECPGKGLLNVRITDKKDKNAVEMTETVIPPLLPCLAWQPRGEKEHPPQDQSCKTAKSSTINIGEMIKPSGTNVRKMN